MTTFNPNDIFNDNGIGNDNSNDYYGVIMNNIQSLQDKEQALYHELNKYGLNVHSKNTIIDEINSIFQQRLQLYNILENNSKFMKNLVDSAENDLRNQRVTIDIIENGLSETKQKFNEIKENHINKLRMVEINTYYSKKYKAYGDLMKLIIMLCIPILIITVLTAKGFVPQRLGVALSTILIAGAILFIGFNVYNLSIKNNMDYDKIDFPFNAEFQTKVDNGNAQNISHVIEDQLRPELDALRENVGMGCIGSDCCDSNMVYNKNSNKCENIHASY